MFADAAPASEEPAPAGGDASNVKAAADALTVDGAPSVEGGVTGAEGNMREKCHRMHACLIGTARESQFAFHHSQLYIH